MNSIELKFFSLNQSKIMRVTSATSIDQQISELLLNFSYNVNETEMKVSVDSLQQNTSDLRDRISTYVDIYKDSLPQLNQLTSFLRNLLEDEYFYIFINTELETNQLAELINHLTALNQGLDFKIIQQDFISIFGALLNEYNISSFNGESRIVVGTSTPKLICRFCMQSSPNVSFNNKSHAISESLGNKGIVCKEECDSCNSKFGRGIETDLISFLSLYRAYFGVRGKGGGAPKLKGQNFSIHKSPTGEVEFKILDDQINLHESIHLRTYEKVVGQNIYRALCKFVISVASRELCLSLHDCIAWINQNKSISQLPPIRMKIMNEVYSEFPNLSVFVRKTDNYELPHVVGELRVASIVLVFIVPLSNSDTHNYDDLLFDNFWSVSQYSKNNQELNWSRYNLESDEKKDLHFNIKFVQNSSSQ